MVYCKLKSKTLLPVGERARRFGLNGVGRGEEKENKNKGALLTRETVGMTLLLFSAVILFIAVTGQYVFGEIGLAITAFFMGLAGYCIYPLLLLALYGSAVMVFGKKFIPARWLWRVCLLIAAVFLIVHTATAERFFAQGYGGYLASCWSAAGENLADGTGGGVLFGLIAYPVRAALSPVGAYIFYSLLIVLSLWLILIATPLRSVLLPSARARSDKRTERAQNHEPVAFDDLPEPEHTPMPQQPAPAQAYSAAGAPAYSAPAYPVGAQGYTAPAYAAQPSRSQQPAQDAPKTSSLPEDPYERSRAMLFAQDPASSYRNNLIFDRDSRFNTYPRSSSVRPVEESTQQSAQTASYTDRYTAETSHTRPAMPRQVTQVRPETPAIEDDFNYPQSPSYRAPAEPSSEEHDYYSHDVESAQEFSSAPTVDDYEDSAYPAYRSSAEPARPTYEATAEPARPAYEAPKPEPVRPTYEVPAEPARPAYEVPKSEPVRPTFTRPVAPVPETEQPAAPAVDEREQQYRNIFSQPVTEHTRITETPSEPSAPVRPTYETPAEPEPPARATYDAPVRPTYETPAEPVRSSFSAPAEPAISRGLTRNEPAPSSETSIEPEPARTEQPLSPASRVFGAPVRDSASDLFDDDEDDVADYRRDDGMAPPPVSSRGESSRISERDRSVVRGSERGLRSAEPVTPIPAEEAPAPQRHIYKPYVYPNADALKEYDNAASVSQSEIEQNSAIIVDTLAGFRVDAEVIRVTTGATVTRYDIDIPRNIAVSQVIKRDAEIAMRLHTRDGVNIYSNSEAGAISIEVPNSKRATVGLKAVMQSDEYINAKPGSLMFAVGQDVEGRNVVGNIVKMTHILVAGSTNSGKSICLDSMLISLICKYSPEELRLILIDPKKTEFIVFDGLPHLMINEIISDAQKAVAAFNWAIKEMERRYDLFEKKTRAGVNVRNVDEYNSARTEDEERLPKIVIVVDELADLMSVAKKDIEERIQRLTQKARAAGIHLVLATQRPSVDVITGVIKGNLPTRMALRVISDVDSRTILDESGAQKLLGNGDMLFRTGGMFNSLRVQGAFVSSREMQEIVQDIKAHNEAYFDSSVADFINKTEAESGGGAGGDVDDGAVDPQYIKALGIVVNLGQASISLIQRKCSVGYNHAGKIIEWMELMGYISPFDGKAKARTVLLSKEDFEAKYGDLN